MAKLVSYTQVTNEYDPAIDGKSLHIIGYTGHGAYWIKGPWTSGGRKRRAQREEMLARLAVAIESDQPPGEVSMDGPRPERLDDTFDPEEY